MLEDINSNFAPVDVRDHPEGQPGARAPGLAPDGRGRDRRRADAERQRDGIPSVRLSAFGRVAAMLNLHRGRRRPAERLQGGAGKAVLTSRAFVENAKLGRSGGEARSLRRVSRGLAARSSGWPTSCGWCCGRCATRAPYREPCGPKIRRPCCSPRARRASPRAWC